jgi:quercetin dioxygenase-like cupin family protein
MADEPIGPLDRSGGAPLPQQLCDVKALAALDSASAGAVWRLAQPGRQLDANLVRLLPDEHIDTHVEPDLDVLLYVVAGDGTLDTPLDRQPLTEGSLFWLPHGSTRAVTAGKGGMCYLTVHRRRPGMRIQTRPTPGTI